MTVGTGLGCNGAARLPHRAQREVERTGIECELRRLRCRSCGVRLEPVPWTRPTAAHTRDFEGVVVWLAQPMAFALITRLLRVGWHTIGPIIARVVGDHLDERRL